MSYYRYELMQRARALFPQDKKARKAWMLLPYEEAERVAAMVKRLKDKCPHCDDTGLMNLNNDDRVRGPCACIIGKELQWKHRQRRRLRHE